MNPLCKEIVKTYKPERNFGRKTKFEKFMASQPSCRKKFANESSLSLSKIHVHAVTDEMSISFKSDVEENPSKMIDEFSVCTDIGKLSEVSGKVQDTFDGYLSEQGENGQFQNLESPKSPVHVVDSYKDDDNVLRKDCNFPKMSSSYAEDSGDGKGAGEPGDQLDKGSFTLVSITKNQAYVSRLPAKKNVHIKEKCMKGQASDITDLSQKDKAGLKKSGVMLGLPKCQRESGLNGIEESLKFLSPLVSVTSSIETGFKEDTSSPEISMISSSDSTVPSDSSPNPEVERLGNSQGKKRKTKYLTTHLDSLNFNNEEMLIDKNCTKLDRNNTCIIDKGASTNRCSYKLRRKSKVDYLGTKINRGYYVESVNKDLGKDLEETSVKNWNLVKVVNNSSVVTDNYDQRKPMNMKRKTYSKRKIEDCNDYMASSNSTVQPALFDGNRVCKKQDLSKKTSVEYDSCIPRKKSQTALELFSQETDRRLVNSCYSQRKRKKINYFATKLGGVDSKSEEMVTDKNYTKGMYINNTKATGFMNLNVKGIIEDYGEHTLQKKASAKNLSGNESMDSLLLENPFLLDCSSPEYSRSYNGSNITLPHERDSGDNISVKTLADEKVLEGKMPEIVIQDSSLLSDRTNLNEEVPAVTLQDKGYSDERISAAVLPGRRQFLGGKYLDKSIILDTSLDKKDPDENISLIILPDVSDAEVISVGVEKERIRSSGASSLSDFSTVDFEMSPPKRIEESTLVTVNVDPLVDGYETSGTVCCENKTNEEDTLKNTSVEIGNNHESVSFHTTGKSFHEVQPPQGLKNMDTVQDMNVKKTELHNDKQVQTTIDKFFPILKATSVIQSSDAQTTKNESGKVNASLLFKTMKDKAFENYIPEKAETGIKFDPLDITEKDFATENAGKVNQHECSVDESCIMVTSDSTVSKHDKYLQTEENLLIVGEFPFGLESVKNVTSVESDAVPSKTVLVVKTKDFVESDSQKGSQAELESMEVPSRDDAITSKTEMKQSHCRKEDKLEDGITITRQEDMCKQQAHPEEIEQVTAAEIHEKQQHGLSDSVVSLVAGEQSQDHRYINSLSYQATASSSGQALGQSSCIWTVHTKTPVATSTLFEVKSGKEEGETVVCAECQHEFKNERALGTHIRYCRKSAASKRETLKVEMTQPSSALTQTAALVTSHQNGTGKKSNEEEKIFFQQSNGDCYSVGDVVWGRFGRNNWWPALVVAAEMVIKSTKEGFVWLYWLSDRQISQVKDSDVELFSVTFTKRCQQKRRLGMQLGIEKALEICASRADVDLKEFGSIEAWTRSERGFLQCDRERFRPDPEFPVPNFVLKDLNCTLECAKSTVVHEKQSKQSTRDTENTDNVVVSTSCMPSSSGLVKHVVYKGMLRDQSVDVVDADQPYGDYANEKACISCRIEVKVGYDHPLFKGKICGKCKENLKESFYAEDDDGCSMFCGVCGEGGYLYVCADNDCGRAFCFSCVEKHTGPATVKQIEETKHWKCFLCTGYSRLSHGDLVPHKDWSLEVVKFFQANRVSMCTDLQYLNDSGRRKLRVLSLFDGIGSGRVALDELGLDVDIYYASEINPDAMLVANFHHCPAQLGDIWDLNATKLAELCPIDLVLAGPPCNDLSIVNPDRKGFSGTGILVWRFVAVLKDIQMICKASNHVFWLMENTASMLTVYKEIISKQFEMEPVVWDAKYFTGQRRARNFWGNIPGMFSTPKFCKQLEKEKKDLDSALISNCNRKARVSHTRTITSSSNSLTITNGVNNALVSMNGEPDHIWVQELERLFGFPIHYTDVGQLTLERRRKLLGKAWSVPVIKHLLSPLKQYFKVKDT